MAVSAFTQLGATVSSNTSGQASLNSGSITFPTTGTAVLGIALIAISGTATAETITVQDNAGSPNVWTVVAAANDGVGSGGGHTAVAYFLYPSAGGGTTVTVTASWGTNVNERFAVFGYATGHDTASPLDTTGTFVGIGSTTSASVSTSGSAAANGLAVTAFTHGQTADPTGFPSSGFTAIDSPNDATRTRCGMFSYQQLAGSGVVTAGAYTVTASSITPPVFSIAVFKAPGTPVNTVAPAVTGTATIGSTLTTDNGSWTNSPSSYSYQWQRDVGTNGVTWVDIAAATASTFVVVKEDIGCKLRCRVTATNGTGNSAPAASNATSVVPTPAGVNTWRIVAGPIAQSDNQVHTTTLALPVLAGDLVLIFAACSNANTIDGNGNKSDVGSFSGGSLTWTQDSEAFSDTNIQHSAQVFSAAAPAGAAYGTTITMTVNGCAAGVACGAPGYHGQSPYWVIVAVSTGDTRVLTLDKQDHQVDLLTSHVAPTVTTTYNDGIVFGFAAATCAALAAAGWWTPAAGFTEIVDVASADASGGESQYQIAAEVQAVSAGYSGGAGGTTAANRNVTNLVVAYSTAPAAGSYKCPSAMMGIGP